MPGLVVQVELVRNLIGAELSAVVEVDPEQLRSPQPSRTLGKLLEMVDLVSVEENCAHAPSHFPVTPEDNPRDR
jgi:hypothetical protein